MADVDIAIVGAGISGVYSAWRLQDRHRDKKIVVYEAGDYVGGRLLSVKPPRIPNMVAELGGMRILPAVQPRISRLIDWLNDDAAKEDRIELYDFPVDKPENIAYLRGVHLRLADLVANPGRMPYKLDFLEFGQTPGQILVNAIEQIVPGITSPELNEYRRRSMAQAAVFDDKKLSELGFWNVLSRVISNEAFELGVDAGGYQSTLLNWNAADAIPWFLSDFGVDPKYKGFKRGFQQVPLMLEKRLIAAGGNRVRLNHRLRNFRWDGSAKRFVLRFRGPKGETTVRAGALILAMPRRALEILARSSPLLEDPEITPLLHSVTPRPLFKLFATYDSPWWRAAGSCVNGQMVPLQEGRTVTDLPIRQTYYWPTDDGKPATNGPAMLMASYDDGNNIGFWDGFRERRGRDWRDEVVSPTHLRVFPGTNAEPGSEWAKYAAPNRMVVEVARQLGIIHGLSYTPRVVDAAFRDWGDDPFGGGWNAWNIGVDSRTVIRRMVQPYDGDGRRGALPLYICGEAYSDAQGWVEGALQTADLMLDRWKIGDL